MYTMYIAGDSIIHGEDPWPGRLLSVDQARRSPEGGPGRQLSVAFRLRRGLCPVGGGALETEGWNGWVGGGAVRREIPKLTCRNIQYIECIPYCLHIHISIDIYIHHVKYVYNVLIDLSEIAGWG